MRVGTTHGNLYLIHTSYAKTNKKSNTLVKKIQNLLICSRTIIVKEKFHFTFYKRCLCLNGQIPIKTKLLIFNGMSLLEAQGMGCNIRIFVVYKILNIRLSSPTLKIVVLRCFPAHVYVILTNWIEHLHYSSVQFSN